MKKTLAVLALLLLIGVLAVVLFFPGGEGFNRLMFTAPGLKSFKTLSALKLPDSVSLDRHIAQGQYLVFDGEAALTLAPSTRGKRGLFFTFQVAATDDEEIKISVRLRRKGKSLKLKTYRGRHCYHSFVREMDWLKQDLITIRFRGRGVAVVNRPVVYRMVEQARRRLVFLIALDTLRYDRVGARRNGRELTPNINRFRRECVDFSQAYAQSNWTLPSFMSLFTGLYEFNHQITRDSSLAEDRPFLISELSEKFFTVNFNAGLWLKGKFGFSRNFDLFSVLSSPKDSLGGQVLFNQTLDFLDRVHPPSLFMFLHTYQIHSPYAPPEEFLTRLGADVPFKKLDSFFYRKQFKGDVSPERRQAMEILYDAEILAFDHFFGNFIRELKIRKLYDRSMIVFLSDHGEEFYEHGGWAHCHSLYNELIRVPLFIKFPGSTRRGERIDACVGLIDVLPTILDFFNVPSGSPVDGISLVPLLEGKEQSRGEIMSSTSIGWLVKQIPPKLAILKDGFKLICHTDYSQEDLEFFESNGLPPRVDEIQLFDLKNDAGETAELAGKEKVRRMNPFRDLVTRMRKTIRDVMMRKRLKNVILSEEEKEKLRSLGYL